MKSSAIEWTDNTFNPWIGCTKVDELCRHCYAETLDQKRMSKTLDGGTAAAPVSHWGPGAPRHRTSVSYWNEAKKWNREVMIAQPPTCDKSERLAPGGDFKLPSETRRPRVFCASLADWLDDEVPIEWLADLLFLIFETSNLTWQLLTKRPENFFPRVNSILGDGEGISRRYGQPFTQWLTAWRDGIPPANIWFGVSAGTQKGIDARIQILHTIPAVVRFLSCEPMLEYVELYSALKVCASWPGEFRGWRDAPNEKVKWHRQSLMPAGWRDAVDWVICGAESTADPNVTPRPLHPHWARCLRDQCAACGVPFFFKQWGDWLPYDQGDAYTLGFKESRLVGDGHVKASGWPVYRVGKKAAGRLLDGREHNDFPEVRR